MRRTSRANDQAVLCDTAGGDSYSLGKVRACRFYFETELPRVGVWLDQVDSLSDAASDMPVEQF